MRAHVLKTAATFGVVIGGSVIVAVAWAFYRHPAMGLMLEAVRFCG